MTRKTITFTAERQVELLESQLRPLHEDEVLVSNEVSAISAGTERACLLDLPNLGDSPPCDFPKVTGYSGVGRVVDTGKQINSVQPGDRVLTHWGSGHSNYNYITEANLLKIEDDSLPSKHAVFAVIAGFSLNGLRKTRLEIGESAAVIGLGILGLFSVALCRIAGATPVIASDLSHARRETALALGADHALDPTARDYIDRVKSISRGGVNATIEVSGQSIALQQALNFAALFGRISLLGCTRVSDSSIDYYQQVHRPGIEIIGAHTNARPKKESRPHSWTWKDDAAALLRFMSDGRLDMTKIFTTAYSPEAAVSIYQKLADAPNDFPVGAVFDWKQISV
ncbi:zinc-dependent alcohol dehydrogenase [Coraliomargarita parva]|uniref:zinc-dependent alcohol dehydrogenase n=1 Tax=Coraliomargarita parva TaxID=3014050 RepID=UPI0022B55CAE|nr:zinc-binding alcohol dehydrogenase [Coraliomargarita parva]